MAEPYSELSKYLEGGTPQQIVDGLMEDGLLSEEAQENPEQVVEALVEAEQAFEAEAVDRPFGWSGPNLVNRLETAVYKYLNASGREMSDR